MKAGCRSLGQIFPGHGGLPALIFLSACLLVAGIFMPVLTVKQVFMTNTFSVLSGIQNLWLEHNIILALIIFFFSIVFPTAKLVILFWIWAFPLADERRKQTIYWLKVLGKWSMLDVFVVAVTIVAVKFGLMATAEPRVGIYVFSLAIIFSMTATFWTDSLSQKC